MYITNTRPLMDRSDMTQSVLGSPGGGMGGIGGSTLRRNASGILAGDKMFRSTGPGGGNPHEHLVQDKQFNNKLRENWLQQTYNEQDQRSAAPMALTQDFNRRVHGEHEHMQSDWKGEFTRYNDTYRDRMMDSLDSLKNTYGKYGGRDADFVSQVRDLENYMHFNKSPSKNPMVEKTSGGMPLVPYQNIGPATVYAKAGALPPTNQYQAPWAGGPYPYYSPWVDHDRKMMRTHLIAQKQTINELNEEVNSIKREGQRFEDLLHKSHVDVHNVNARHFPGAGLLPGHKHGSHYHANQDPRDLMVKWGDAETDKSLRGLAQKEQELVRVLSKLPENSEMYRSKRSKLEQLVNERAELEKMLYSKADYKNYMHEKVVDDQKKDNLGQWLRRDLELFKIDKMEEEHHYKFQHGFLLYWDYILNLAKQFKQIQIVYGIYHKGMTLFEPRLVQLTDTIDTTHPSFAQVIFNINHLVRDIEPNPEILLIFEVQVPAYKNTKQAKNSNIADPKLSTGYLISRYGKTRGAGLNGTNDYENQENDDNYDIEPDTTVFQTYGWSVLDLFNFKNDLKRGTYKIPLYLPPTIINLDVRDIPQLERIKDVMLWMRVAHPKDDELNEVRCEPSYYHIYYVPEIHNIAPKIEMQVRPQRDPSYHCDGLTVYLHWVKGHAHSRPVRLAVALQMDRNILAQDSGHLCFYATRGINAIKQRDLMNSAGKGILKALNSQGRETPANTFVPPQTAQGTGLFDDPDKMVEFNEMRTWYRDLYNLIWDGDRQENAYLIIQYIELKEEVKRPDPSTNITRELIEREYDLRGYSVFQLNSPDATIRYGTYILDMYDGQIFVGDQDPNYLNGKKVKITISRPGQYVKEANKNEAVSRQNPRTRDQVRSAISVNGDERRTPGGSQEQGIPQTPKSAKKVRIQEPDNEEQRPRGQSRAGGRRDERPERETSKRDRERDRGAQKDRRRTKGDKTADSRSPSRSDYGDEEQIPPRTPSRNRNNSDGNVGGSERNPSRSRRDKGVTPDNEREQRTSRRQKDPETPTSRHFKGNTPDRDKRRTPSRSRRERDDRDGNRTNRDDDVKRRSSRSKRDNPNKEVDRDDRRARHSDNRKSNRSGSRRSFRDRDEDPWDTNRDINDQLNLLDERVNAQSHFIPNQVPQYANESFLPGSGIDFYIDASRFLPDNATVTKIAMTAYDIDQKPISVSAGGLADFDSSTTYMHYYGFRYEFRLPQFNPSTLVLITIYTIDRTSNQVSTLGYSLINLFLNKTTLEPVYTSKINPREYLLQEGSYQLPIFIEDPRKLPKLRMDYANLLEKLPCTSLLVRIRKAPQDLNNQVLSAKTVPQSKWAEKGVIVKAPEYQDVAYNTLFYRVSDVELELFASRASRIERPIKDTATILMAALSNARSKNNSTMQDWYDLKLASDGDDPPMIDMKYLSDYDTDFGFKIAVDGIHNLPKKQGTFYVVILSLNPPASLYNANEIPSTDVKLIATYDWDSSVSSVRFLDNYHYFQSIESDPSMTAVYDVRSIEFVQGVPKVTQVAWTAIPIFFNRYGIDYVRSGVFQVPLFRGPVDKQHLDAMYNYDDPWNYLIQRLNDRTIPLWDGVSVVTRIVDSQREGHFMKPFDYERFNYAYLPEQMMQKLNYAYTASTDARLASTPRLITILPPGADKAAFQESVFRTFNNNLGLSNFK